MHVNGGFTINVNKMNVMDTPRYIEYVWQKGQAYALNLNQWES